ncbi:MAG: hypothetical protein Kow00108_16470 [Calditrichia bacterium]
MVARNDVYNLNQDKSPQDFKLKSMEWAILTQIDGVKSVDEVAKILSLTDEEINTYFGSLQDKDLIIVKEEKTQVEYVTPEVIKEIEDELLVLVGPVAAVIIDDTLIEMNVDRESLPKPKIGQFVELISHEIDDTEKRMKFLEVVLPRVNQL